MADDVVDLTAGADSPTVAVIDLSDDASSVAASPVVARSLSAGPSRPIQTRLNPVPLSRRISQSTVDSSPSQLSRRINQSIVDSNLSRPIQTRLNFGPFPNRFNQSSSRAPASFSAIQRPNQRQRSLSSFTTSDRRYRPMGPVMAAERAVQEEMDRMLAMSLQTEGYGWNSWRLSILFRSSFLLINLDLSTKPINWFQGLLNCTNGFSLFRCNNLDFLSTVQISAVLLQ
jgi:hypothetical protein